ncbi:MAG: 6,7-dimethyl-8-ribityllumazine synthase [Clostridia bacterium]|nr:MAG: 6,7-dimethyl-8-ribityllumazine synthase [Clostridia bacterium]
MAKVIEGKLVGEGVKIGIVISRFNEFITGRLLSGALDALNRHGTASEDIDIIWVPGAFEVPLTAKKAVATGKYDAVICLGAVIRGATPHFEYVAAETAKGVAKVGLEAGRPVVYGILTADNLEQAIERAGTKAGNRGYDAAVAALEMVNLWRELEGENRGN